MEALKRVNQSHVSIEGVRPQEIIIMTSKRPPYGQNNELDAKDVNLKMSWGLNLFNDINLIFSDNYYPNEASQNLANQRQEIVMKIFKTKCCIVKLNGTRVF